MSWRADEPQLACSASRGSRDFAYSRATPSVELTCSSGRQTPTSNTSHQGNGALSPAVPLLRERQGGLQSGIPASVLPPARTCPSTHLVNVTQSVEGCRILGAALAAVERGGAGVAGARVNLHRRGAASGQAGGQAAGS